MAEKQSEIGHTIVVHGEPNNQGNETRLEVVIGSSQMEKIRLAKSVIQKEFERFINTRTQHAVDSFKDHRHVCREFMLWLKQRPPY